RPRPRGARHHRDRDHLRQAGRAAGQGHGHAATTGAVRAPRCRRARPAERGRLTVGALLGLVLGIGLLLVHRSFVAPLPSRRPRRSRLRELLGAAGAPGTAPSAVVALCLGAALLAGLVVQAVSGTWPVSTAFALLAGYLPVAVVKGRARRRQRELAD